MISYPRPWKCKVNIEVRKMIADALKLWKKEKKRDEDQKRPHS